MGGCRCSYRDCTARSDGKIHMFHFPVFDKIRCHQWISNAQKTDFLNLKLSQLKNRVVCQHHFKDECFMNETKARLKANALPTEDGPYCSTKNQQVPENILPIDIDDIDNEIISHNEKKAHMSVKYGDFLTNDVENKDLLNQGNTSLIIDNFDKYDARIDYNISDLYPKVKSITFITNDDGLQSNDVNTYRSKVRQTPETNQNVHEVLTNPIFNQNITHEINTQQIQNTKQPDQNMSMNTSYTGRKQDSYDRKISILSHKKITGPVKIEGKLEPVSPSSLIKLPKKKKIQQTSYINSDNSITIEVPAIETKTETPVQTVFEYKQPNVPENELMTFQDIQSNNENIFQSFNLENELQAAMNPQNDQNNLDKNMYPAYEPLNVTNVNTQTNAANLPETEKPAIKTLLKAKLPPEKKAEIEEKRKYNMKVTDILDSCFKKCDEEPFNMDINKILEEKQKIKDKSSGQLQSPNTNLKTPKRNSFAYIEEQLQRMESNLLAKIEENTQSIVQLKRTVKPEVQRRTVSTQTKELSNEAHKKQLYVEISKYLTPDANSLIFEELFINQYMEPSEKKRKVR